MTAKTIDGVAVSKSIRAQCALQVQNLQREHNITPGLAVILVGEDAASQIYVRNKMKADEEVGVISKPHDFPSNVNPEARKISGSNY